MSQAPKDTALLKHSIISSRRRFISQLTGCYIGLNIEANSQHAYASSLLHPKDDELPSTLSKALPLVADDRSTAGVMLFVNPEGAIRDTTRQFPELLNGRYQLNSILPAFHRTNVPVGSLHVAAPTRMILYDEDRALKAASGLMALPPEIKVLYLLSTLPRERWASLGQSGVGAEDFTGEASDVFESLLPDPFSYTRFTTDKDGNQIASQMPPEILKPDDRLRVKLCVGKTLSLSIAAGVGASAGSIPVWMTTWYGEHGGVRLASALPGSELQGNKKVPWSSFHKLAPNKVKPGDLDYTSGRFSGNMSLAGVSKFGELVSKAGGAAGIRLHVDRRLADSSVVIWGNEARIGDILSAAALAVTGTFRSVESDYVLVSSLTGYGQQMLKLADAQGNQNIELESFKQKALDRITLTGGPTLLDFDPADPLMQDGQLRDWLQSRSEHTSYPTEKLPTGFRKFLNDFGEKMRNIPSRNWNPNTGSVTIEPGASYWFSLPDGTALRDKAALGILQLSPQESRIATGKPTSPPLPDAPFKIPSTKKSRLLLLSVDSQEEARLAVTEAAHFGFNQLGIRTEDLVVVKAAVSAGESMRIGIMVVMSPFAVPRAATTAGLPGASRETVELDRNLLGESGSQIAARHLADKRWLSYVSNLIASINPHPSPEQINDASGDCLAPNKEAISLRWSKLAAISSIPGLAGVLLSKTQPAGYSGARAKNDCGPIFGSDIALPESLNLGYAPETRAAFLRAYGVDPIDIVPSGIQVTDGFAPNFFSYVSLANLLAASPPSTATKNWESFRSNLNQAAIEQLFNSIRLERPDLPVWIEARAAVDNDGMQAGEQATFLSWSRADELPRMPAHSALPQNAIQPLLIAKPDANDLAKDLTWDNVENLNSLQSQSASRGSQADNVAIDLRAESFDQSIELLKRLFMPAQSIEKKALA